MTRHIDEEATFEQHPALKRQQEEPRMPSDIEAISALAWNNIKDKADPEFNQCAANHREKLVTHATSVRDHGVLEGATRFDREVAKLLKDPDGTAAAVSKAKVEAAQAIADQAAENAKAVAVAASAEAKVAKADAKADAKVAEADAKAAKADEKK